MRYPRLFFVFASVLLSAVVPAQTQKFVASNADGNLLHTHDDYVRSMPVDVSSSTVVAQRVANAKYDEVHDLVSDHGTYHLTGTFVAPGLATMSHLVVAKTDADALETAAELYRAAHAVQTKKGYTTVSIAGLETWYPGSHFDVVMNDKSAPIGNNFVIVKDAHVYSLTLIGPLFLGDADSTRQFLQPKLESLLAFQPNLPAMARADAASGADRDKITREVQAETRQEGVILQLLLFHLITAAAGICIATIVNSVGRRRVVNRLTAGVVGVAAYAGWLLYSAHLYAQRAAAGGQPDYVLEGEVLGDTLISAIAAIVVLVLVRSAYRNWPGQVAPSVTKSEA